MRDCWWIAFLALCHAAQAFVVPAQKPPNISSRALGVDLFKFHRAESWCLKLTSESGADHFDMEELRQRIKEEYGPSVPFSGGSTKVGSPRPTKVHIVLFHPGTTQQGAHTIEYPKGSGTNLVLAFESAKSCDRFAASLKKQNFFDPTPNEFNLADLQTACDQLGVFVQVVPDGVELTPPSGNVKTFGHSPGLSKTKKYLNDLIEMSEDELEDIGVLDAPLASILSSGAWE